MFKSVNSECHDRRLAARSPRAAGHTALPVAGSLVSVYGVCSARRGIGWLNFGRGAERAARRAGRNIRSIGAGRERA